MKKTGILLLALGFFSACNNTATLENKADSLERKIDSLGRKVWDSGKQDIKELKEKIENQFKEKDTADK